MVVIAMILVITNQNTSNTTDSDEREGGTAGGEKNGSNLPLVSEGERPGGLSTEGVARSLRYQIAKGTVLRYQFENLEFYVFLVENSMILLARNTDFSCNVSQRDCSGLEEICDVSLVSESPLFSRFVTL